MKTTLTVSEANSLLRSNPVGVTLFGMESTSTVQIVPDEQVNRATIENLHQILGRIKANAKLENRIEKIKELREWFHKQGISMGLADAKMTVELFIP